jgi:hypothetical protein
VQPGRRASASKMLSGVGWSMQLLVRISPAARVPQPGPPTSARQPDAGAAPKTAPPPNLAHPLANHTPTVAPTSRAPCP